MTDDNAGLYGDEGVAECVSALAPGGVLSVWSAAARTGVRAEAS